MRPDTKKREEDLYLLAMQSNRAGKDVQQQLRVMKDRDRKKTLTLMGEEFVFTR